MGAQNFKIVDLTVKSRYSLYAAYNILSFYSLERTDPPTYFILMQLRSLFIGIIYQLLFKQKLTFYQWVSMAVLTFGTMTKEFTIDGGLGITLSSAIPIIAIQIVCSCTASVYNEYLLKSRNVDFWVQNLFFYTNSILINFFIFISTNDLALNHIDPILQPPGNNQFWPHRCW